MKLYGQERTITVSLESIDELEATHFALSHRGKQFRTVSEQQQWWNVAYKLGGLLGTQESEVLPFELHDGEAELAIRAILWQTERTNPAQDTFSPALRRSDDALYLEIREQLDELAIVIPNE